MVCRRWCCRSGTGQLARAWVGLRVAGGDDDDWDWDWDWDWCSCCVAALVAAAAFIIDWDWLGNGRCRSSIRLRLHRPARRELWPLPLALARRL